MDFKVTQSSRSMMFKSTPAFFLFSFHFSLRYVVDFASMQSGWYGCAVRVRILIRKESPLHHGDGWRRTLGSQHLGSLKGKFAVNRRGMSDPWPQCGRRLRRDDPTPRSTWSHRQNIHISRFVLPFDRSSSNMNRRAGEPSYSFSYMARNLALNPTSFLEFSSNGWIGKFGVRGRLQQPPWEWLLLPVGGRCSEDVSEDVSPAWDGPQAVDMMGNSREGCSRGGTSAYSRFLRYTNVASSKFKTDRVETYFLNDEVCGRSGTRVSLSITCFFIVLKWALLTPTSVRKPSIWVEVKPRRFNLLINLMQRLTWVSNQVGVGSDFEGISRWTIYQLA